MTLDKEKDAMKTIISATAAILVATSLGAAAQAATFHPAGSHFTGTGPTSLSKNGLTVNCTGNFAGTTSADGTTAQVTSASFTGSSICTSIKSLNLPWQGVPVNSGVAQLNGVTVQASAFGQCGPSNGQGTVSSSGVINFNNVPLSGNCTVSGNIQTSPALTVN